MKQTAVEWLYKNLLDNPMSNEDVIYNINVFEQAKEMELEQHQETFKQSRQAKIFEKDMPPVWESFDEYYNETFKSE